MSTLLKKPFIEEVVDGLDDASISSFQKFLDMGDGYSTSYQLRKGKLPTGANPSVERCTLLIDGPAQLCGIYAKYKKGNEERSAMVSFTTLETCTMYEIDESRLTCHRVRERLSASELRRVLRERDIARTENGSTVYGGGLEVKSNGDVTVGRNLEVEGTTKLNSGIEPIHMYEFSTNYRLFRLYVYEEKIESNGGHIFFGLMYDKYTNSTNFDYYYCSGTYYLKNEQISILRFISFIDNQIYTSTFINGNYNYQICIDDKTIKNYISNLQPKLYRHTLTLTASDKTYILVYDSTSNINADSVADLRTIMKISSSHESEVLPICSSDMTSTACLKVTASLCQIGTNNVTLISDKVDLK